MTRVTIVSHRQIETNGRTE